MIKTDIEDITGKIISIGDILADNVPTRGIVKLHKGEIVVTSNYQGKDINSTESVDRLDQDLVDENFMRVIGNIQDNPELLEEHQ